MTQVTNLLKDFFENAPLYMSLTLPGEHNKERSHKLKEIQAFCEKCDTSKPFHNMEKNDYVIYFPAWDRVKSFVLQFKCVTCGDSSKKFWVKMEQTDDAFFKYEKIGQDPKIELSRSKHLSKFFKSDKDEYNKAVICIAHGYGVAAFAYMRRIIENNIMQLLDMIAEDDMVDSSIKEALSELRNESPMSDKISIANKALPSYLLINGHNPLGAMYKVLSEGVHSLSDEECLRRTETVQKCLEYIISGIATHKKSKEAFKDNLDLLKSY
ncbi:hypothetical protein WKI25_08930 [Acinetobacter baumannii]